MADRPTDTQKRLAAFNALMDAIVTESAYWAGQREDTARVQFLADAVDDPSQLPDPTERTPDDELPEHDA